MEPLATVPAPGAMAPGEASPMALSADGRFLFAGFERAPFSVWTFAIHPSTGLLEYAGRGALDDVACYIAPDSAGRFLLSAAYHAGTVTVNAIGSDSVVGERRSVASGRTNAHCAVFAPSGRHVLSTSLGNDVVYQDRFDPETGVLTPKDPPTRSVRMGAGPRHLTFSSDARFAYLLCERDASVYVFPFDAATGLMGAEVQVTSALPDGFTGKPTAADIHLTPDGRFLYASERTSATLAAFQVDAASGTLTRIGSFPTVNEPRGFRVDPSGRYVLVAGTKSASVRVHGIEAESGALTTLADYPAGENANWVECVVLP